MKLQWAKDRKHAILIAETRHEVAFCDILTSDLTSHKYAFTKTTAKYMIRSDEPVVAKV